jgi:hypothetical protein
MPLRDHFHRPDGRTQNWDQVHGGWPMVLVQHLTRNLPPGYRAAPLVHLGAWEFDVVALETDSPPATGAGSGAGGTAAAVLSLPTPSLTIDAEPPDVDEYSVRVFDDANGERLVATVEFVSPANKDRPRKRRLFVDKCAALLREGVCVSLVDCVTQYQFNLYADLLDLLGHADPIMGQPAHPLYAVTLRRRETDDGRWRLETWAHQLHVGRPLPALPLWWTATDGTMLPLETTYEETCQTLRLPAG